MKSYKSYYLSLCVFILLFSVVRWGYAGTIQEVLVSGIRSEKDQFLFDPKPQESIYLKTFHGGFNVSKYGARYYCLWDLIKERDDVLYVRMELDDPLNKKNPIIQEGIVEQKAKSLNVAFGPIKGLKMYGSYRIQVFLYADKDMTKLVDQLTQEMKSYVDTRRNKMLIDKGLVTSDGEKIVDIINK